MTQLDAAAGFWHISYDAHFERAMGIFWPRFRADAPEFGIMEFPRGFICSSQ
jgi:hypothetical protein